MTDKREISSTFKQAVLAQYTSEVYLCLLEIWHTDLGSDNPIRLVANTEDVVSTLGEGDSSGATEYTFIAFGFDFIWPNQTENQVPKAKLSVPAVDRRIVEAIRSISSAPTIKIYIVLNSDPNHVEVSFPELTLDNADWDVFTVSGVLSMGRFLDEPWPGDRFTPARFPGLF